MDIVDTQLHVNQLGIDAAIAAMDAVGVRAVVFHESWGLGEHGQTVPSYPLTGGGFRHLQPTAELAALHHPDRFAYVCEIDRRDPHMATLMAMLRDHENRIGLRLLLLPESAELAAFTEGGYDRYFEAAQDHRLPTFVYLPDHPELLRPYARRFPEVPLILDHCGLRFGGASAATYQAVIAGERPASATAPSDAFARFDDVLALAELPNVALKWAHAPRGSSGPYPYDDVLVQLERALETFGPQRIMWASDHTTSKPWHSWAEALFCIREHGGISEEDKEWILGRAARTLLRWPAP